MMHNELEIDPQRFEAFERFKLDEHTIFELVDPSQRRAMTKVLQDGQFVTSSQGYLMLTPDAEGRITLPQGTMVDRGSGIIARLKKPLTVEAESLNYGLGTSTLPDGSKIYFAYHVHGEDAL